ncbi:MULTISPECIES: 2-isopropylmalate synthase [unclassified Bifidobacterium]|uniref:2-isopropylmalate synthase n=1 Tax=unclassified Bifidobacterium TaxID=2608897 RepID=UPI0011264C7F|nr:MULTISPECIES: 2-isopropylmalate synthase [unclassified Bifidobacterium]TPF77538.1 2-isopropylmalate synthase [Bifidobacterium sp. UTCIF-1]TPF79579.1 2-isopropylmalate synthase [Bifidobacterium sp. UTCIF-24]TPF81502.1 2-isopropylmalate synthase [Bifidobacterium sp. UTCIF-3]TPF83615.1 2-isopropylmalate synthase [Bifidobacterium sp. UTCIF-36]TPF88390.1 2-isopropylmalate synthase [Bifidobacterium sp. UTBIF-56]
MGQDQSSVFDLAAVAAASNGGNNDPLLPPARFIGDPQKPSRMPYNKYVAYDKQIPFDYPERTWPGKRLQRAPRWCSVDLRDGNQALVNPMDSERKLRFWNLLVSMGFKEIEVGFPSASETDFDFIRMLIERELIPDDVTIVVLTQCREHLIRRTYEALKGAKRAIVHFYNSVSVLQREVVFRKNREEIKKLATDAAELCKDLESEAKGIDLYYEYSPESFTGTEPEYAVEVCNAVIGVIKPTPEHPMIINLPATVEMTTPNVFADEVEYVSTHLDDRDAVVLSLHPHNDEGMGVAATELAVLAGADRVEGCLLGNGERTGNVDLVTLGLNWLTQGIDPQLDLSNVPEIRKTVEYCNQIKISERHPYAGNFVFTAFSGSHQDAIKKGLEARQVAADRAGADLSSFVWLVPYLPIDPKDIGRSYEAIIRVNSQSGKGGMAYLLKTNHNLDLPKRLQVEFDKVVQKYADDTKKEVKDEDIWRLFKDEYLPVEQSGMTAAGVVVGDTHDTSLEPWGRLKLLKVAISSGEDGSDTVLKARLLDRGVNVGVDEPVEREVSGIGNGPIAAFLNAISDFGVDASIMDYVEHTMSVGTNAMAASYVECQVGEADDAQIVWGVGIDSSITTSALKAIISAVNRSNRAR